MLAVRLAVAAGAIATVVYAPVKHWAVVIPTEAWAGGIAAAIAIGAIAGAAARAPCTHGGATDRVKRCPGV
jgi:hypothetical protein